MAHLAVTVALLFLACVLAVPAPEPSNPRFTLAKDSNVGVGLADQNSAAHGVITSNKAVETPVAAPVDTGNKVPDVTLFEKVNAGSAIATRGSTATGVISADQLPTNQNQVSSIPIFG